MMLPVPTLLVMLAAPTMFVRLTVKVSSSSSMVSPITCTVIVMLVWPTAKLSVPDGAPCNPAPAMAVPLMVVKSIVTGTLVGLESVTENTALAVGVPFHERDIADRQGWRRRPTIVPVAGSDAGVAN